MAISADPTRKDSTTIANVDKWLYELVCKVKKLEDDSNNQKTLILVLQKDVIELKQTIAEKDVEIQALKQAPSNPNILAADFWKNLPKEASNAISIVSTKETQIQQKKEKNLIIFGIPESQGENDNEKNLADKAKVLNILSKIEIDGQADNVKTVRFKSNTSTKPGRILIECDTTELKMEILRAAKQLRNIDICKEIYINNDLTSAQTEREKTLRLERNTKNRNLDHTGENNLKYGTMVVDGKEVKFYWGIRSGELKKIKF
jgi:hypothetical protein